MRNITVRLSGGLGNQLHCYAFGKALEMHQKVDVIYDCESSYWNDKYGRCYLLDRFPYAKIKKYNLPKTRIIRFMHRYHYKVVGAINKKLLPLSLRSIVYEIKSSDNFYGVLKHKYYFKPYFIGCWASYRYYNGFEDCLRSELRLPLPSHPDALRWLQIIKKEKSCFIHYRTYNEVAGIVLDNMYNYYKKAISVIVKMVPHVKFYVFSDDPNAARTVLGDIIINMEYVELHDSVGDVDVNSLNDFFLMYSCDHAIIGNSTFSWWAAWLSEQKGKYVVAPDGLSPWGDDWAPSAWIKLGL